MMMTNATNAVALDCEMVTGPNGKNLLANVAIVDENGKCINNYYVKHPNVVDYRTAITGISAKHLQSGMQYEAVQRKVSDIINGRILVGHDLEHDLEALGLNHPEEKKRDTFYFFRNEKSKSLKDLAKKHLDLSIQKGHHNAVEDARATMRLYKKFEDKEGWVPKSSSEESSSED